MNTTDFQKKWQALDRQIQTWWDQDVKSAREPELCDPEINKVWYADEAHRQQEARGAGGPTRTLLYLPFPYVTPGGSESSFPEMYCWDTYFINVGLALHGRYDLIRRHIQNQLFMIERYGMVLTGNRTYYLGHTQTPVHPASIELDYQHRGDRDLLARAYPLLKQEYRGYWLAGHHHTETGLARNFYFPDSPDYRETMPRYPAGPVPLRPELAAEAEILDFTAIFDGDVRRCNPLQTNSALVRYANTLAWMAGELGWAEDAAEWRAEAERRAEQIRNLCWNEDEGFFFEYQYVNGKQLPYWSLAAYWAMWAGVATREQAAKLVAHLHRFENAYGLAQTDRAYPSPHPEYQTLQWDYPHGWPPSQMIVVEALQKYGYLEEAQRVAGKFLQLQIDLHETTGQLWEKYNVVDGNLDLPRERYPGVPLHGWAAAAVAYLGRVVAGWQ